MEYISVNEIYNRMIEETPPIEDGYIAPELVLEVWTSLLGVNEEKLDCSVWEQYCDFVFAVGGMLYCCGYDITAEALDEDGVYCADFKSRNTEGFLRVKYVAKLSYTDLIALRAFGHGSTWWPTLLTFAEDVIEPICRMVDSGEIAAYSGFQDE